MKPHLVTCDLTKDRLKAAIGVINDTCEQQPILIQAGDAAKINDFDVEDQEKIWNERIDLIRGILVENIENKIINGEKGLSMRVYTKETNRHTFLKYRKLSMGEKSVLMKHLFAMVMIANGEDKHGIILEDDIVAIPNGERKMEELKELLKTNTVDYVDIAGGCGLKLKGGYGKRRIAERIRLPRTRTNAAYVVSKRMAKVIVENYLPLVFPIDWHLQYIMFSKMMGEFKIKCYWTTTPIFGHGSETGEYKSWRK